MKQKEFAFGNRNRPEWGRLPSPARNKLRRLMARLLERAWQEAKEVGDERQDH